MHDFGGNRRGSATQWFALVAAVLCIASLAGAHTLDWLSQSGRVSVMADGASAPSGTRLTAADPGIDTMPTGSIGPSRGLVIRIR